MEDFYNIWREFTFAMIKCPLSTYKTLSIFGKML